MLRKQDELKRGRSALQEGKWEGEKGKDRKRREREVGRSSGRENSGRLRGAIGRRKRVVDDGEGD